MIEATSLSIDEYYNLMEDFGWWMKLDKIIYIELSFLGVIIKTWSNQLSIEI